MRLVPPISIARGGGDRHCLHALEPGLRRVSKPVRAGGPPLRPVTIRHLVAGVIALGIATMLGVKRRLGWCDGLA